jgi:dihydropteroate synthase
VGVSRKSMIGAATGRSVDQRLAGSVAAATLALQGGASIIRSHDVAATVDAIKVYSAYCGNLAFD